MTLQAGMILPIIDTERLILRAIQNEDREALYSIYSDKAVMEFAADPVFTDISTVDQMLQSVANLHSKGVSFEWCVSLKGSGMVIGTCGIHSFNNCRTEAEIGCLLHSDYWRQGYMSEAVTALLSLASRYGIKQAIADIDDGNVRSRQFFIRLGFEYRSGTHFVLSL